MKIIFFGTPEYVVPILEAIHKTYDSARERNLVGVVTQPPQKAGREQKLTFSAVDHFAHDRKIPVFTDLEDLPDFDLGICAAYGRIIPDEIINRPKYGILNIHPSLLPKYRGTGPTQGAIIAGDKKTGVTVIKTDKEMDHGPIVSSFKAEVLPTDTGETLRTRLFEQTVPFLLELIPSYISGKINLKEQDHTIATFTRMLKKEHGFLKPEYLKAAMDGIELNDIWAIPVIKDFAVRPNAETVDRFIRALSPWPGAFTQVRIKEETKRLKVLKAHISEGKLILDEVQLEGKNPVTWEQFKSGYPEAF